MEQTESKKYCVYIHITPSDKVYIGQTSTNPNDRWQNGKGYKKQVFYNAIIKYGWDNIKHKILFDSLTKEEALEKEIELISYYKSNDKRYGYNISPGGEDGHNNLWNDIEYKEAQIRERKERWKNTNFVEKHKESMKIAMSKSSYKEKQASHTKNRWKDGEFNDVFCRKVLCLETGIIYESITNASKLTGICRTNIGKCCNKQMLSAGGCHWIFYDNKDYTEEERLQIIDDLGCGKGIKIICVETGKKYNSIKEAAKDVCGDNSSIGKALKGKQKTANGYHWRYEK